MLTDFKRFWASFTSFTTIYRNNNNNKYMTNRNKFKESKKRKINL